MKLNNMFLKKSFAFVTACFVATSLLSPSFVLAQTWPLTGANTSHPLTLMTASELPSMRTKIANDAGLDTLYDEVYTEAQAAIPATSNRRGRAALAKNAAFVLITGYDDNGTTLSSGDQTTLETKVISLLDSLDPDVGTSLDYLDWQWRSKELIDYLIAYDLLLGYGTSSSSLTTAYTQLATFAGNLHYHNTFVYQGYSVIGLIRNNHAFMHDAAVGMAGLVLHGHPSAEDWLNTSLWSLDDGMFNYHATRGSDGFYSEGPYYWYYAAIHLIPFFETLKNTLPDTQYTWTHDSNTVGPIPLPPYDDDYYSIFDWAIDLRLPDGRLPWLEDGFTFTVPAAFAIFDEQYNLDFTYKSLSDGLDETNDLRTSYLAQVAASPTSVGSFPDFISSSDSGNILFRGENDLYASIFAESGRALTGHLSTNGHNQGDETSFLMMYNGEEMAIDPGYLSWYMRDQVSAAHNHNLILVDGAGPGDDDLDHSDGTLTTGTEAVTIEHSHQLFEDSLAQISSTYEGVDIERTFVELDNRSLVIFDQAADTSSHTYRYQLNGRGTYTQAGDIDRWQENSTLMDALVVAGNNLQSRSTTTDVHEVSYNVTGNHTKLQMDSTGNDAQFMSFLYPYTTSENAPAMSLVTTPSGTSAGQVDASDKNTIYTVFQQSSSTSQTVTQANTNLLGDVVADAQGLVLGVDDSTKAFEKLVVVDGTSVNYAGDTYTSSVNTIWHITKASPAVWYGHTESATTITMPTAEPSQVNGSNVSNYSYDAQTGITTVTLSGPGQFSIVSASAQQNGPINISDALTSSLPDADATHYLSFESGAALDTGEQIRVSIPDFDWSGMTMGDISAEVDSTSYSIGATCVGNDFSGSLSTAAGYIDLTPCSNSIVGAGSIVEIAIGQTSFLANPSVTGSYPVYLTVAGIGAQTMVAIVDSVNVSADIDASFTFVVDGVAMGDMNHSFGGACEDAGASDQTSVTTTSTTIPFGQLTANQSRCASQRLSVSTNASNGFTVSVHQDQDMTSATGDAIKSYRDNNVGLSPETYTTPSGVTGNLDTYGHFGVSSEDNSLSGGDTYSDGDAFDNISSTPTAPTEIFYHNGPSDGQTDATGRTYVGYIVEVTDLQPAGLYTNSLIYTAIPTF